MTAARPAPPAGFWPRGSAASCSNSRASSRGSTRELPANDWQVRDAITAEGRAGAGTADDRNVILLVDWPRP